MDRVTRRVSRVVIRNGPHAGLVLPIVGGDLTIDLHSDVRRAARLDVVGVPGLAPSDVGDLLDPRTGTEVRIEQSLDDVWVSRGIYGVSSAKVTRHARGVTISIDVEDRSHRVKLAGCPRRWVIPAGTTHSAAIRGVLGMVAPWLPVAVTGAPTTLGEDVVIEYAADAWKACRDLAEAAGMDLHVDVSGVCVWTPASAALAATPRAVDWLTIDRAIAAEQAINAVGAQWTEPRPDDAPTGWEAKTGLEEAVDEESSTGIHSWMGRRVAEYRGDRTLLTSPTAAMQAAKIDLLRRMDVTYSGAGTVIPDPTLDVDQVIVLDGDRMRVTKLSIDLAGGPTSVTLGIPPLDMATLLARASQPIRAYRTREVVVSVSPLRTRLASDPHRSEIRVLPTGAVSRVAAGQVVEVQHEGLGARAAVAVVGEVPPPDPLEQIGVEYQAYVQDVGWQGWVRDGAGAGTTGSSLRIEAIRVRLYHK